VLSHWAFCSVGLFPSPWEYWSGMILARLAVSTAAPLSSPVCPAAPRKCPARERYGARPDRIALAASLAS